MTGGTGMSGSYLQHAFLLWVRDSAGTTAEIAVNCLYETVHPEKHHFCRHCGPCAVGKVRHEKAGGTLVEEGKYVSRLYLGLSAVAILSNK